jgi:starch-binding outer membrane protein, SusD/RagB family
MKRINLKKLIIPGSLALIALGVGCGKNFLTKPPIGVLPPNLVANYAGVQGILIGAYSDLTGEGTSQGGAWGSAPDNWVYASVCADDAYKGSTSSDQGDIINLQQWQALNNNPFLSQKYDASYDGVQRANDVIRTMRVSTGLTPADTVEFKAEALFLRAFFHFELRKMFYYPPFVDEYVTFANNNANVPNVDGSGNYIEIWPRIEADLTYAMANLPATQPNKGQANKYAAEAFLAKVYMFEAKFAQAQTLLDDLIANGVTASGAAYALQPNYANNFNPDPSAKNTSESVFAVQIAVNDGSSNASVGGKAYGDNLNFPYGGGPGACCGFDNPTQDLADAFKTDANGLPLPLNSFNSAPHVSDGSPVPYTGNLDPRIDITMGRQGIPYLDWGLEPGDKWIRSPADDGHFCPKKDVYASSVSHTLVDQSSFWANVETPAVNINLIRYSDVLLWDAECLAVTGGDLAKAESYVNMVRSRAANKIGWVYLNGTFDAASYTYKGGTIPADKYDVAPYPAGYFTNGTVAMQAIIMERRIELAEEGQRFFDLQRWQLGNPVFPTPGSNFMTTTLDKYATIEAPIHPNQYQGVQFTTGRSEYYPLPLDQLDVENGTGKVLLKQIPGY